ncbi:MAG: hypothetical protein ACKVQW_12505 [Pyrinomonadaceae bacterium]
MKQDNKQSSKLWVALPTAIIAGVANVMLFFLFMVLYGHVINPGHEESFYQQAANRLGPVASIIGGIPLMYMAGCWIGKRVGAELAVTAGILVWLIYLTIDLAIVAASGIEMTDLPMVVISFVTKLGGVYLGARHSVKANSDGP